MPISVLPEEDLFNAIAIAISSAKFVDCRLPENLWISGTCPDICRSDSSWFLCEYVLPIPDKRMHASISHSSLVHLRFESQFIELGRALNTQAGKYAVFQAQSLAKKYGRFVSMYSQFYLGLFWQPENGHE